MLRSELADKIYDFGSNLETIATYIKDNQDKRAREISRRDIDVYELEELIEDFLDDNFEEDPRPASKEDEEQ